jgi:hypothetical protein
MRTGMCVCVVCVLMYVCVCVGVWPCLGACVCVCAQTCRHMWVCLHVHAQTSAHVFACLCTLSYPLVCCGTPFCVYEYAPLCLHVVVFCMLLQSCARARAGCQQWHWPLHRGEEYPCEQDIPVKSFDQDPLWPSSGVLVLGKSVKSPKVDNPGGRGFDHCIAAIPGSGADHGGEERKPRCKKRLDHCETYKNLRVSNGATLTSGR